MVHVVLHGPSHIVGIFKSLYKTVIKPNRKDHATCLAMPDDNQLSQFIVWNPPNFIYGCLIYRKRLFSERHFVDKWSTFLAILQKLPITLLKFFFCKTNLITNAEQHVSNLYNFSLLVAATLTSLKVIRYTY